MNKTIILIIKMSIEIDNNSSSITYLSMMAPMIEYDCIDNESNRLLIL
jgi:hypothetical protein